MLETVAESGRIFTPPPASQPMSALLEAPPPTVVAHPDRQQLHFSNMFSLQEFLSSQMLSSMMQPSVSTAPQPSFGMPFDAQFYVLMNAHLQNMLNTMPQKVKEEAEESEEHKTQRSFSIDNLLRPESEEKQASNTPDSDLTTYTLDALEVSDGRTKTTRKFSNSRCVCDQCGKSYATTSNLSRHKQTHRPLDSEHAKQCPHCDRVYVSMPALRVHCAGKSPTPFQHRASAVPDVLIDRCRHGVGMALALAIPYAIVYNSTLFFCSRVIFAPILVNAHSAVLIVEKVLQIEAI
ncbi:unnamed protein product [Cylicocyclus nassatus]|uniref:C2H2-type domain-containing protein n=1 Tax=Cylicocyclus nassatus TaxID=53992 RepID=A0AA36DTU7_CYLNA|nr:unnamed protein product [Cylicocyclus nassatus]